MAITGRSGTPYTLNFPLTCVFETTSRLQYGINSAHFMITNLARATYNDLQFDSALDIDAANPFYLLPVKFYAGYISEGPAPLVFQGNVLKAFSYRDGPDVVTDITLLDGQAAAQQSQVAAAVAAPWTAQAVVDILTPLMAPFGVQYGGASTLIGTTPQARGMMALGSTYDVLAKLAASRNCTACISQGKIYLMGPQDYIVVPGALPQLDVTTGIIGTPRRSGYNVDVTMLFEPRVALGQQIIVVSTVNQAINGTYRVDGIDHRGIISGAKGGPLLTTFHLFNNTKPMYPVASR
jgi:hypothetical protein